MKRNLFPLIIISLLLISCDKDDNPIEPLNKSITVTNPQAGDMWRKSSQQSIKWQNENFDDNVRIQLFKGGTTQNHLVHEFAESALNTSEYQIVVPSTLVNGSDYKVCVSDVATGSIKGFSQGYFSIQDALVLSCENGFWYNGNCFDTSLLINWGLGNTENEYVHSDREYEWYIDQAHTGTHSGNNCGPSSVTMAALWYNSNFSRTAEDARETYVPGGGWWYTNNIIDYLNLYSVPNLTVQFLNENQIYEIVKNGNIIILCIDTGFIRYNSNPVQRVDRFYSYAGGHFLVVKGVRKVDNKNFFEVYDPNNWDLRYSDNSEKGKSRHYRSEDVAAAIGNWWNYLIVVSETRLAKKDFEFAVDPDEIVHQWGR